MNKGFPAIEKLMLMEGLYQFGTFEIKPIIAEFQSLLQQQQRDKEIISGLLVLAQNYLEWVKLDSRLKLTQIPDGIESAIQTANMRLKDKTNEQ